MPDIRLVPIQSADVITLDWLQTPVGLLDETSELASAVTLALCSDALAAPTDTLPDPNQSDRRGWWGDQDAELIWRGWPIGSKLWLLTRSKITHAGAREGPTLVRVQNYVASAMQPFVKVGLCSSFTVNAWETTPQQISARVVMYRGPKSAIALEYQAVWLEIFPPPHSPGTF